MTNPTDQLEAEIVAAGATKAPRITPADIEARIVGEHYFTAAKACGMAPIEGVDFIPPREVCALDLLTFCVLVLANGFTVTGESACASPENFNEEIGRKIARQNAVAKIWPLMGYELRSRLASGATVGEPNDGLQPHQRRVVAERQELNDRLLKLQAFLCTKDYQALESEEQKRLRDQADHMYRYSMTLRDRIEAFGN